MLIILDRGARGTYTGIPWYHRTILEGSKERLREVVHAKGTLMAPIRVVSKTVYSDILKIRVLREPFLGPIQRRITGLGPCASGSSSQAMHEHQVGNCGVSGIE